MFNIPVFPMTDGAELAGGGVGQAVFRERPSGAVRFDVVLVTAAEGTSHQPRGHPGPECDQHQPTGGA